MEWGDVDGISDGEVHRGIDHVPQSWFVVLDGATFTVAVSEEDEFLPLTCPQCTHTLSIHLYTQYMANSRCACNTRKQFMMGTDKSVIPGQWLFRAYELGIHMICPVAVMYILTLTTRNLMNFEVRRISLYGYM